MAPPPPSSLLAGLPAGSSGGGEGRERGGRGAEAGGRGESNFQHYMPHEGSYRLASSNDETI